MSTTRAGSFGGDPWGSVRDKLRARGLRWTPQRRALVEVLSASSGHVTGGELVERCRAIDPATVPSTVYRTLAVLEELGMVSHSHGHDGREEFHVLPEVAHGHLFCSRCGGTWEISEAQAASLAATLRTARGFDMDLTHLSVGGLCESCQDARGAAVSPRRGAHPGH